MVLEKIAAILADHVDCDASTITADTTLESLGIDSLDTVEMVMELEEEFDIELEIEEKLTTVGEMVALIEEKLGK